MSASGWRDAEGRPYLGGEPAFEANVVRLIAAVLLTWVTQDALTTKSLRRWTGRMNAVLLREPCDRFTPYAEPIGDWCAYQSRGGKRIGPALGLKPLP